MHVVKCGQKVTSIWVETLIKSSLVRSGRKKMCGGAAPFQNYSIIPYTILYDRKIAFIKEVC